MHMLLHVCVCVRAHAEANHLGNNHTFSTLDSYSFLRNIKWVRSFTTCVKLHHLLIISLIASLFEGVNLRAQQKKTSR